MSGARITVELQAPDLQRAQANWQRLSRDPAPLMRAIGPRLVSNTHDRFDAEQDPDGRPWAALSPGYAAIKVGLGILRGEGGSRAGLQGSVTFDVAGQELAVGSKKEYAAVHQFGATIRPKNKTFLSFRTASGMAFVRSVTIPARPYLGLSSRDEEDIFDAVEFFLTRAR